LVYVCNVLACHSSLQEHPFTDTIAAVSFRAILIQATDELEYDFGEHSEFTADNKWQSHISFYTTDDDTPLFIIYGKASDRRNVARESALIRALVYIDEVLGFRIGDVNYARYLFRRRDLQIR